MRLLRGGIGAGTGIPQGVPFLQHKDIHYLPRMLGQKPGCLLQANHVWVCGVGTGRVGDDTVGPRLPLRMDSIQPVSFAGDINVVHHSTRTGPRLWRAVAGMACFSCDSWFRETIL